MLSNWFSEKTGNPTVKNDGVETSAINASPTTTSAAATPKSPAPPYPQKASTPSYESPHDAIIARIDNELQELQTAAVSDSGIDPDRIAQLGEPPPPRLRSRDLPENMYDPFDGQSIGLMIPGEFEEEEDDLWTHLARIRDLQSDIARMHAQMERLGEIDRFGVEQPAEDEAINVEDEAKAAKAAEFAKLSDQFNGRKEAIDAVMAKLGTLSHSINEFHSSRAPLFRSLASPGASTDKKATGDCGSNSIRPSMDRSAPEQRFLSPSDEGVFKDSPELMGEGIEDHSES